MLIGSDDHAYPYNLIRNDGETYILSNPYSPPLSEKRAAKAQEKI
jgi:hypothetical protein